MRSFCLFLGLALAFAACQRPPAAPTVAPIISHDSIFPFPQAWEGKWYGDLIIYANAQEVQRVPMQLHILPLDNGRHTWGIIYGPDTIQGLRPYELRPKDPSRGFYQTDEQNGIVLEDFLHGNALYSRFEVMGNLLLSIYERTPEGITFTIVSGSSQAISSTGGQADSIPEVKSFYLPSVQKAYLRRR